MTLRPKETVVGPASAERMIGEGWLELKRVDGMVHLVESASSYERRLQKAAARKASNYAYRQYLDVWTRTGSHAQACVAYEQAGGFEP